MGMKVALLTLATMILCSGAVKADLTLVGVSGLIETPDDSITPTNSVALTYGQVNDIAKSDYKVTTFGGMIGIMPNLEVGAVGFDSDNPGVKTRALANAKYRIMAESLEKPSVTIGVVDLFNQLEKYDSDIDTASAFVVVGKNITNIAEGVSGMISKPIRGTFGLGTGIYKGIFAGLSWATAPKFDVMVEYLSQGISDDSTVNAALKFNATKGVTI
jgi:hypothetical protein